MQIGSLGEVVFEASSRKLVSPSAFTASYEVRYADHEVLGSPDVTEYLAPKPAEVTIQIRLYSSMCDIDEAMGHLTDYMAGGAAVQLIFCGRDFGQYTIRKMEETIAPQLKDRNLTPSYVDLQLTLKEYY